IPSNHPKPAHELYPCLAAQNHRGRRRRPRLARNCLIGNDADGAPGPLVRNVWNGKTFSVEEQLKWATMKSDTAISSAVRAATTLSRAWTPEYDDDEGRPPSVQVHASLTFRALAQVSPYYPTVPSPFSGSWSGSVSVTLTNQAGDPVFAALTRFLPRSAYGG